MLIINLILLLVGCFIEPVSGILLLGPLLAPLAFAAEIDPVQFGVIFVMNLNFGLCTPPLGLALYVVSDISGESVASVSRAILPFYVPMLLTLAATASIPALTLWLPGMLL
jgi:TRAP-type C4-dicarboxylate transport system permease large subunit